jgi:hypothetical protein
MQSPAASGGELTNGLNRVVPKDCLAVVVSLLETHAVASP